MIKRSKTPQTVGEFLELLQRYPKDMQLFLNITEVFPDGSVYPAVSNLMEIDDGDELVILTFADGGTLPQS